jgi:hypothetical protein
MQVFLPYPDFATSTACLDPKRLGNQIYRECKTLILGGWANHPCSKMWAKYHTALAQYALCGLDELARRGKFYPHHIDFYTRWTYNSDVVMPHWLGHEQFHSAHRSILLAKNFDWYSKFGWVEKPAQMIDGKFPYIWF